jgi:hypothetical protein
MPSNNYIYKMSNAGGMSTITRYTDMLAGNAVWNPWEPAGAYESIAVATVPSGGVASITFSSIPQTYTHLQVRGIMRQFTGGNTGTFGLVTTFNGDRGSNYTASHVLFGTGASANAGASSTSQSSGTSVNYPGSGETANAFGAMVVDILDYANVTKYKTLRGFGGYDGNNTNGIVTLRSFAWMNTNAINSITFDFASSANLAEFTSIALYGIKG